MIEYLKRELIKIWALKDKLFKEMNKRSTKWQMTENYIKLSKSMYYVSSASHIALHKWYSFRRLSS